MAQHMVVKTLVKRSRRIKLWSLRLPVGHGRQSPQSRVSNGPPIRLRFKSSSLAITVVGWGRQGWRQPSAPPAYLAKTQEGSGQTTVRVIHAKTREEAWIPLFDDGEAIFLELASSPAAFA